MLLVSRRRQKIRKFENEKLFNFYLNNFDKINSNSHPLIHKFKFDDLSQSDKNKQKSNKKKQKNIFSNFQNKVNSNQNSNTLLTGKFPEISREIIDKKKKNCLNKKVKRNENNNDNVKDEKLNESKCLSSKKISLKKINIKKDKKFNQLNSKSNHNKN